MRSKPNHLVRDRQYFIVMFADENLEIPIVQTLIFKKEGKRPDGSAYFLFKELHLGGTESDFLVNQEDADHLVLDQQRLLQKLRDCFDKTLLTSRPRG